eukprot:92191_1
MTQRHTSLLRSVSSPDQHTIQNQEQPTTDSIPRTQSQLQISDPEKNLVSQLHLQHSPIYAKFTEIVLTQQRLAQLTSRRSGTEILDDRYQFVLPLHVRAYFERTRYEPIERQRKRETAGALSMLFIHYAKFLQPKRQISGVITFSRIEHANETISLSEFLYFCAHFGLLQDD